ncbi:uncharacterized protein ATNIH1004_004007 [Aspergillus tanneri]|uniref:Uncharacterized protein n=1 Tax=Aspergillus tanneri TaxID=1220188 RepID=A0A5M9MRV9_9EURO|nr:uncharacterized protein ATNIH1004_004007 [Aspergillus tanneri]KAA8648124.1 hypothetical protein ATNIH1004_004007 [Aspergillus tanneri]
MAMGRGIRKRCAAMKESQALPSSAQRGFAIARTVVGLGAAGVPPSPSNNVIHNDAQKRLGAETGEAKFNRAPYDLYATHQFTNPIIATLNTSWPL